MDKDNKTYSMSIRVSEEELENGKFYDAGVHLLPGLSRRGQHDSRRDAVDADVRCPFQGGGLGGVLKRLLRDSIDA